METAVYYFSATGNSLKAAGIIAERLGAKLYPMVQHKGEVCTADRIGLVFPTYFWGVPRTVADFIAELKIVQMTPYVFAITTYGEIHGGVLGHVSGLLQKKGVELNYGREILAVANFVEEYNPRVHLADVRLPKADQAALAAAREIENGTFNAPFRYRAGDRLFYKLYTGFKLNRDRGFRVDDTCTRCGICQKICPNGNITLKNGKPEFLHKCEHCVACINCCPQRAIQWRNVTRKRNRYRHPDVTIKEIINGMQGGRSEE